MSSTETQEEERAHSGEWSVRPRRSGFLRDRRVRTSLLSIATDFLLVAIKAGLALVTGSLALAADAFHSLSDMVVSVSVLAGILLRRMRQGSAGGGEQAPASGYWIEATIAGLVSLVILYIPVEIISEVRAQTHGELQHAWAGILGVLFCIAIAYFASRLKIFVGRDTDSPALEADGYHSQVDMLTSVAVLFSLMGQVIGIELDAIVAVVIAVLIGITGIDLLVSSIVSLVRRTSLHQLALWETLFEALNHQFGALAHRLTGRRLHLPRRQKLLRALRPRFYLPPAVAAGAAYLASGLAVVGPGEHGVRSRFGAVIETGLQPGLHYHLPFPFESITPVDVGGVRRVEVGFRADPALTTDVSSMLWEERHGRAGYQKVEQESLMLTGDEGAVDLSLVVQFRPLDAVRHRLRTQAIEEVVRGLAESNARRVLAGVAYEAAVGAERTRIAGAIRSALAHDARQFDLGIDIVAVHVHDLHPPLKVVPAFRDVFSAREDRAKLLSEAQAYRNEALPQVRSEQVQRLGEAESEALEQRLHARGDAGKFEQVAQAYRQAPDVTGYRLYLEAVEAGLADREKLVADPRVNRGEYRTWLFAPDMEPQATPRFSTKTRQ